MCVIAHCETKLPDLEQLLKMQTSNRAGGGVAWFERDHVRWAKGINAHRIFNIIQAVKLPVVIHFRLATVGGESKKLCHPFPLTEKAQLDVRGTAEGVLFHNGHESSWEKYLAASGAKIGQGPVSDTRALAAVTGKNRNPGWLNHVSGKFVAMFDNKVVRIGEFTELDGVRYSNLYWNYAPSSTYAGGGSNGSRGRVYMNGSFVDDDWRRDSEYHGGEFTHLNGVTYGNNGWYHNGVQHSRACTCQPCLTEDRLARARKHKKPFHQQTGLAGATTHGINCYCQPCINDRNTKTLKVACTRADSATDCAVQVELPRENQIMVCGKWETERVRPTNHADDCNCVPCVEWRNQQFFLAEDAALARQVEEHEAELARAEAEGNTGRPIEAVVKTVVESICKDAVAATIIAGPNKDKNRIVLTLDGVQFTQSALEAVATAHGVSYDKLVEDIGENLVSAGNGQ